MDRHFGHSIPHVRERDVDLMFLQLIQTSSEFRDWFVQQLDPDLSVKQLLGSRKSARNDSAQVDIAFAVETSSGQIHYILVENKINESIQKQQPERYYEEGESYLQDSKCDVFHVCLIAPEAYPDEEKRNRFGNTVTYEAIRRKVSELDHAGSPTISELFQVAIEKDLSGSEPTISEVRARLDSYNELPNLKYRSTDKQLFVKSTDPAHPNCVEYVLRSLGESDGKEVDLKIEVATTDPAAKDEIRNAILDCENELGYHSRDSWDNTVILKKIGQKVGETTEEFHNRISEEFCSLILLYHTCLTGDTNDEPGSDIIL